MFFAVACFHSVKEIYHILTNVEVIELYMQYSPEYGPSIVLEIVILMYLNI